MDSAVRATLLQLGLSSCRLRTWRVLCPRDRICIEMNAGDGSILFFSGNVRTREQSSASTFEYLVELEAMPRDKEDKLAREAAQLVRRRSTTTAA